jgi:predicted DNA-binding transcriptional regulator AlpA
MEQQEQQSKDAFIGIRKVCELSGLSKSTILRYIIAQRFPKPVIHSGNLARWDLGEVMKWRAEQFRVRAEREQTERATV